MKKQMKMIVVLVIALFMLNGVSNAQIDLSKIVKKQENLNIELKSVQLDIEIRETFAKTNLSINVKNNENTTFQSEFTFKIPSKALITNLSMTVNYLTFWGVINRVEEASNIYENATAEGKSAILLTNIGPSFYKLEYSVARLSDVSVSIFYVERLIRKTNEYNLEINHPNIYSLSVQKWSTSIDILSPNRQISKVNSPAEYIRNNISLNHFSLMESFSNNYLEGKLESISYSLSGNGLGTNTNTFASGPDEYFFTTFSPVLEDVGEQVGKDFVFLLDTSGSMADGKLTQAKSALISILDTLFIDDRVGIVKFSTSATLAKPDLVNKSSSSDIQTLKGWVSALYESGTTNILEALKKGLSFFDNSSRPKILVLLTDGYPTEGITDLEQIESQFSQANIELGVSLYALGFGTDLDFNFLQRISRNNNGEGVQIPVNDNSLEALNDFYSIISTPLIVNLNVNINSGVDGPLYPYFQPNIYQGSELFLVGKRSGIIDITITGETSSSTGNWQIYYNQNSSTNEDDQWVADLWAITVIDDLLTQIKYTTGNKTDLINQVTEIALEFGLVTPYTAITVVVPDLDQLINQNSQPTTVEGNLPDSFSTVYATTMQGSYTATETASAATPGFELVIIIVSILVLNSIRIKKKKN
jgi:Ca-activated chloride channel family protein